MTQKLHKAKTKSFTGTFIKQNIKENKKFLILLFVLQFLGFPFGLILLTINKILEKKNNYMLADSFEILLYVCVATFGVASFLGIVMAVRSFGYLHKKPLADDTLSLPLSTNQRFFGSYISGIVIYIIPYISAILLSVIIILFYGYKIDPQVLGSAEFEFILCAVIGLFTMIMLYTTTVFTCSCCGNTFESVIYSILLNITVPLFIYIFNFTACYDQPGLHPMDEASASLSVSGTFGGLYKTFFLLADNNLPHNSGPVLFDVFIWILKYTVIIALLIAFSLFLYRKRKAEDISKPFVFSFIYYFFIILVVISVLLFSLMSEFELAGIILSFIIYITFDLIKTRGIGKLKKHALSLLCYVASIVVAFSIAKISASTDGFGKTNYVPDEKNISFIEISTSGYGIYTEYTDSIKVTDDKSIKQIIKLHQAILSYDHDEISCYTYDSKPYHIQLNYTTNFGKKIFRSYYVPFNEWNETLLYIAEDKTFKTQTADSFDRNIRSEYDDIMDYSISDYKDNNIYARSKFNSQNYNTGIKYGDDKLISELSDAYRKDIMAVTKEDLMDFKTYCIIKGYYIPKSFKNTIAILDKKVPDIETQSQIEFYNYSDPIEISTSDQIKNTYKPKSDLITTSYRGEGYYLLTSYDHNILNSIIDAAEPNYFTYDDCYIVKLMGKNYIIPPEYSSLAQKFIDTSEYEIITREYYD